MTPEEAAALLGVRVDATRAEIEFAYRRAARASHPDITGESTAFMRVTEAHDVLLDAQTAAVVEPQRAEPPLSIPLLITWVALMGFAIAVSIGASGFPLTPLEPVLRFGLLAVGSIGYAITGKRVYLVLAVIGIAATAVATVLFTSFGSLLGMLLLAAPLYGLLITRARLRRV
jgi:hypothetical protein